MVTVLMFLMVVWMPLALLAVRPRLATAVARCGSPVKLVAFYRNWLLMGGVLTVSGFVLMAYGYFGGGGPTAFTCGVLFVGLTGPWAYAGTVVCRQVEAV